MRISKYMVVSAAAVVLTGAMLSGSLSNAASATGVARGSRADTPELSQRLMPGTFIPQPTYGNQGSALVVYTGGNIDDLEIAASTAGASGVWVQDVTGRFQLLPVGGPTFLKSGFASAFPSASAGAPSFPQLIAVTLVR